MRTALLIVSLVVGGLYGSAQAADENPCAKMNGQERAACEKQHAMGQEKMKAKAKAKAMGEEMRARGEKEKGKLSDMGGAGHENHDMAKMKPKPKQ